MAAPTRSHRGRSAVVLTACVASVVAGAACGAARPRPAPTAASEAQAIRDARAAQNVAIRERDLDGIARHLESDVQVTSGTGTHVRGRDAYRAAFEDEFRASDDVTYRRVPDSIELSSVGGSRGDDLLAAERGTWTGSWTTRRGPVSMRGVYSAMWRKRDGRWRIRSELFVALTCSGAGCPR